MRNDECIIYIYYNDKLVNTWYKEGDKWVLISTRGILHHATAEQFLSHLLHLGIKTRKPSYCNDNANSALSWVTLGSQARTEKKCFLLFYHFPSAVYESDYHNQ
jgi:hypothetical protein